MGMGCCGEQARAGKSRQELARAKMQCFLLQGEYASVAGMIAAASQDPKANRPVIRSGLMNSKKLLHRSSRPLEPLLNLALGNCISQLY